MDLCSSAWLHSGSWVFSISKWLSIAAWPWLLKMIEQNHNQSQNWNNVLSLQSWIFVMLAVGSLFKPVWAWTQISISVLVDKSEVRSGSTPFLVIDFPTWGARSPPAKLLTALLAKHWIQSLNSFSLECDIVSYSSLLSPFQTSYLSKCQVTPFSPSISFSTPCCIWCLSHSSCYPGKRRRYFSTCTILPNFYRD